MGKMTNLLLKYLFLPMREKLGHECNYEGGAGNNGSTMRARRPWASGRMSFFGGDGVLRILQQATP
eukprot:1973212-Amphidinium_carterae.1